jgi:hypothetical protein
VAGLKIRQIYEIICCMNIGNCFSRVIFINVSYKSGEYVRMREEAPKQDGDGG